MIPLADFKRDLERCQRIEDFIDVVADFIGSIEDPDLRMLTLAEFEATLLEGDGRVND